MAAPNGDGGWTFLRLPTPPSPPLQQALTDVVEPDGTKEHILEKLLFFFTLKCLFDVWQPNDL